MTTEVFWDQHAPSYAAKPIADPQAYEAMLIRVRSFLQASDHVLEIGCGTGGTALQLAPGVAHITATDIAGEMIRIAREKLAASAATNVAFAKADAADEIQGAPFDAILAFSLLHLVDDIPAVLSQTRAQLKPGGLLISKTVCLKDRSVIIRGMVRTLTRFGFAPRVTPLSRQNLVDHLENAGFALLYDGYFDEHHMNPFLVAKRLD